MKPIIYLHRSISGLKMTGVLALTLTYLTVFAGTAITFPFYDGFDASLGSGILGTNFIDGNYWQFGAPSTGMQVTNAVSMSFPGLQLPAAGSQGVQLTNTGVSQAIGGSIGSVSSGSVYASFLIKVTTKTSGNRIIYEMHNSSSGFVSTTPAFAVYLNGTNQLGLFKSSTTSIGLCPTPLTNSAGVFITNFVVVRYTFNTNNATDDTCDLWLNPATSSFGLSTNPTPDIAGAGVGSADTASLKTFWFGLFTSSSGAYNYDEFRLGTNWAQVTPSAILPDANKSTVSASPTINVPADGSAISTITITATNSAGQPISGIAASNVVVAASGSGNTVTQPTLPTDANGQTTATIISTSAGTKTISVAISGVPIIQQPTVQFISASSQFLVWSGNSSANWDISSVNWLNSVTSSPANYNQGDFVTFDDSVSASGNTNVNLTTTLSPGSLLVSNVNQNFTFNGSGAISGNIALIKAGLGVLTLANSGGNTFSNGVSILGGTLRLSGADNQLPTNSSVTITNLAATFLDLNSNSQILNSISGGGTSGGAINLGAGTLTISGGGTYGGVINGSGMLVKTNYLTGGTLTLTNGNTYSGGTVVGGFTNNTTLVVANATGSGTGSGLLLVLTNGTLTFGNGAAAGSVSTANITNHGTIQLKRSDDSVFTNIMVGAGSLVVNQTNSNTVTIAANNSFSGGTTVTAGALLISNGSALGSGLVSLQQASLCELQLTNGVTLTNALSLVIRASSSPGPNIENVGGSNVISGPIQLINNGSIGAGISATAGYLLISGSIVASPTNSTQVTTRTLRLEGATGIGEWSGAINDTVNNVTNIAVHMDGPSTWILSGNNTYTGPTVVTNGTLLINGNSTAATNIVTVANATLGGSGTIGGATTVNAGGNLVAGKGGVGTLTFNKNLTLNAASTNIFVVTTGGGVSNRVVVNSQLSPSSSMIEINTAGGQLAGGSYRLISYSTIDGTTFTSTPVFDTLQTTSTSAIVDDGSGHINLVVASTVTVSSDASLSALTLNPLGTLSPVFASGTTNYTATNANATTLVTMTATNTSAFATNQLFLNGVPQGAPVAGALSTTVLLGVGSTNVIKVQVTAQDGVTVSNYTVTVTRLPSTNAYLTALAISPAGTLTPT
ncbi:MAG: autotransporter-associated beta strand repeat-containing protein, partial [Verrucomicrobiae bacterium]